MKVQIRRYDVNYFGELLPVDGFHVTLNVSLPQNYAESLHHLYQPLLGIEAINLYELFIAEAKFMAHLSLEQQTHHTLMSQLNLPLYLIYEARVKLEAIGLLRTYKRETETEKLFLYEIIPPFTPEEFFQDIMLTELLHRQVGDERFSNLKKHYAKANQTEKGKNITKTFNEVFQTYEPKQDVAKTSVEKMQTKPEIVLVPVDFNIISSALKQRKLPVSRILTDTNRRIITQVANLYDLETYEIEKALLWALTDEHTLDIEQFQAACHDFFKNKQNANNVKLTFTLSENNSTKKISNANRTQIDQLIERFETITPKQLLEDLSEGHHASEQDLKMIRDIMVRQGIPTPVMNVLIHFTLLKSNMQLSRPYMEKIASHWSRAKLKTAREAMEFAKKQLSEPKQSNKRNNRRTQFQKKEVIPDWFYERKQQKEKHEEKPLSKEEQRAKEELAAILKKYDSN